MRAALILLAVLTTGCDPQPEGEPVTRVEFGQGGAATVLAEPEAQQASSGATEGPCERVMFEGVPLTHCVADPARHRIALTLGPQGGAPYRSLTALSSSRPSAAPPVAFAMNAGMFDAEGKPIGYYVEAGNRLKELNRAAGDGNFHMLPNGVFYGTNGEWRVRTADDFYTSVADRPAFGTQSGPMLLIDGKLHPEISEDGPSKNVRNGVGVDAQGRAHFVISDGALSFGKLARYFRDVAKTPNALYLDGAVSALWDPANKRLDRRGNLGPLVVVEEKAD